MKKRIVAGLLCLLVLPALSLFAAAKSGSLDAAIAAETRALAIEIESEGVVLLTDSDNDFAKDRIHPSAVGNEKIALTVLQTLYDNGLGSETVPVINTPGIDARGTGVFTIFVNLYGRFFHLLSVIRHLFVR